jgi:hypothetical protein
MGCNSIKNREKFVGLLYDIENVHVDIEEIVYRNISVI